MIVTVASSCAVSGCPSSSWPVAVTTSVCVEPALPVTAPVKVQVAWSGPPGAWSSGWSTLPISEPQVPFAARLP